MPCFLRPWRRGRRHTSHTSAAPRSRATPPFDGDRADAALRHLGDDIPRHSVELFVGAQPQGHGVHAQATDRSSGLRAAGAAVKVRSVGSRRTNDPARRWRARATVGCRRRCLAMALLAQVVEHLPSRVPRPPAQTRWPRVKNAVATRHRRRETACDCLSSGCPDPSAQGGAARRLADAGSTRGALCARCVSLSVELQVVPTSTLALSTDAFGLVPRQFQAWTEWIQPSIRTECREPSATTRVVHANLSWQCHPGEAPLDDRGISQPNHARQGHYALHLGHFRAFRRVRGGAPKRVRDPGSFPWGRVGQTWRPCSQVGTGLRW